MKIILGLGNPGKKYESTWHNIGFLALDEFQKKHNFPDFSFSNKFDSFISEEQISGEKIILAKPNTYMNESGKAASALLDFYKSPVSDLIVVHDDVDLLLSKIKISQGAGSAGHKGIESILSRVNSPNFLRIRIGISPDLVKTKKAQDFVLTKMGGSNKKVAKDAIENANEALFLIINSESEKAMSEYNK